MATDWRSAYFTQAEADYRLFRKLAKQDDVPLCQKLHYLQMTTEKMSKGFSTQPNSGKYPNTHKAFEEFIEDVAKKERRLWRLCGFRPSEAKKFNAYLKKVGAKAKLVEALAPTGGASRPNPEYPWETNSGAIITPVEYDFPDLDLYDNKMQDMLGFLDRCFELIASELESEA